MTRVEESGLRWMTCPKCFGNWFGRTALMRRIREPMDTSEGAPTIAELAEIVSSSQSAKDRRCPQCEKPMAKDRFHMMIPVTIDRCKACNCVWLDVGEMMLIHRLHHELVTSDDPEIVRRRDRIGQVMAQAEAHKAGAAHVDGGWSLDHLDTSGGFNLLDFFLKL
jgi:Zn-finger nucleic acid-binding protein